MLVLWPQQKSSSTAAPQQKSRNRKPQQKSRNRKGRNRKRVQNIFLLRLFYCGRRSSRPKYLPKPRRNRRRRSRFYGAIEALLYDPPILPIHFHQILFKGVLAKPTPLVESATFSGNCFLLYCQIVGLCSTGFESCWKQVQSNVFEKTYFYYVLHLQLNLLKTGLGKCIRTKII